MNINKRINNFYQGKILSKNEKNFNKNYERIYEGHKTIYKDHYLLSHAFNILDYVKNENNEIDPKEYLQEDRKEKYKINICNFEKALKLDKTKKLYSIDDELLKILLFKINRKNIEEQLKKREEKRNFQNLSLKGIRKKNSFEKTFNTTESMKSHNNFSGYSSFKNFNSPNVNDKNSSKMLETKYYSLDNNFSHTKRIFMRYEKPTQFYFNSLNSKLKDIFQNINSEEKNILTKSNSLKANFKRMFKTNNYNKLSSKTLNAKAILKPKFIIKNPGTIKKKKDLENILFKEYDLTFNRLKKQLYKTYKFPKLKIKVD